MALRVFMLAALLVAPWTAPGPVRAASQERADSLAGPPPGGVAGKVMNERGDPLPGAKVVIRRGELVKSIVTDEAGEYCFCKLAPARDYVLEIQMDGFVGVIERDFTVAKSRISIRNAMLDSLADFHWPSPGAKSP